MFRRFRPKIRVYGNRCNGCSFKATIHFLIWNDVELVGLQNCYLGFSKFWKFPKISKMFNIFFPFSKFSPSKSKFSKTILYVRGQCLMNMCTQFQVDIFKNGWMASEMAFNIITCVSSFVVSETAEPWHWSHTKNKLTYLFRARSFISKRGVLLVIIQFASPEWLESRPLLPAGNEVIDHSQDLPYISSSNVCVPPPSSPSWHDCNISYATQLADNNLQVSYITPHSIKFTISW